MIVTLRLSDESEKKVNELMQFYGYKTASKSIDRAINYYMLLKSEEKALKKIIDEQNAVIRNLKRVIKNKLQADNDLKNIFDAI